MKIVLVLIMLSSSWSYFELVGNEHTKFELIRAELACQLRTHCQSNKSAKDFAIELMSKLENQDEFNQFLIYFRNELALGKNLDTKKINELINAIQLEVTERNQQIDLEVMSLSGASVGILAAIAPKGLKLILPTSAIAWVLGAYSTIYKKYKVIF